MAENLRGHDPKAPSKRKQSSLETANEMFKDAFAMKRMRFAEANPDLSEEELNKKTAEYFRKLSEKK